MGREASAEELHRISRFLFREAALLDNRRYSEWLTLFAEDFTYEAPIRIHRQQQGLEDSWAVAKELGGPQDLPMVRFDRPTLEESVARILTGKTVNNDPPWFTERLISNIMADHGAEEDSFVVHSKFLICRFKAGENQFIPGSRMDDLRLTGEKFSIRNRRIVFNSNTYQWGDFAYI